MSAEDENCLRMRRAWLLGDDVRNGVGTNLVILTLRHVAHVRHFSFDQVCSGLQGSDADYVTGADQTGQPIDMPLQPIAKLGGIDAMK
jgi:hypothetical protein